MPARSVPKLGRSKSEMSSATSLAAGTSRIGPILISRPRSVADGMAQSPQLGERVSLAGISLLVETSSLFLITGNLSL